MGFGGAGLGRHDERDGVILHVGAQRTWWQMSLRPMISPWSSTGSTSIWSFWMVRSTMEVRSERGGIRHQDLHQEAIELGFGQR